MVALEMAPVIAQEMAPSGPGGGLQMALAMVKGVEMAAQLCDG